MLFNKHLLVCRRTKDWTYVPKACKKSVEYNRFRYLRKLVNDDPSQLQPDDYKLLAYLPQILGPQVFGEVVAHEGRWRWTFASASLDVHSENFSSKDAATKDLAKIQRQLYPHWSQNEKREVHLRNVIRVQENQKRLHSLAMESTLQFARPLIMRAGLDMNPIIQEPILGFPYLGNTCYILSLIHI